MGAYKWGGGGGGGGGGRELIGRSLQYFNTAAANDATQYHLLCPNPYNTCIGLVSWKM